MSAPLAIDARGVRKRFGEGALSFEALKGVDLQVARGEVLMLAGPSGSGKTTLLSILGCVLSPTAGEVRLLGEEISVLGEAELAALRLASIGFVFQGYNLIAALPSRDNVALVLEMRGVPRPQALSQADELLSKVGLAERRHHRPRDLSGGQRQRVAIARALVSEPSLVFADEPTAALDAQSGLQVSELLRQLTKERGTTAVIVTHDNRIFHLADRIVHIEDGSILPEENKEKLHDTSA